jgi:hypothetical protein
VGAVVLLVVTYALEIIIDNVSARLTWRWMRVPSGSQDCASPRPISPGSTLPKGCSDACSFLKSPNSSRRGCLHFDCGSCNGANRGAGLPDATL